MKLDLNLFPLMGDQITQRLFQVFAHHGILARFVGGCVRDAVLGKNAHDIDIAVPIPPDVIIDILTTAGIKFIPTGYNFGTITAIIDNRSFQITSLRLDWETDGRYARVIYGTNWEADALRRDFTINALYAERDGTILDYFEGLADLKIGLIRFVGDAHQRIREDYLRILRYFRFLAWYGHGSVHGEAIQACTELYSGLEELSRERISHEFLKLLAAPAPLMSLELMNQTGLVRYIVAQPFNLKALKSLFDFEKAPSLLCRLAALSLPQIDVENLVKSLRLSRDQKQYLQQCHNRLKEYPSSEKAIYPNLYQDGATLFQDLTMLSLTSCPSSSTPSILATAFQAAASWQHPSFPLKGKDLVEMGMKPDLKLGSLLKRCEEWWIEQNFQPDREACLRWIRDRKS